jgi:hypothetical protein
MGFREFLGDSLNLKDPIDRALADDRGAGGAFLVLDQRR